jgi:hypothetical protein
MRYMLANLCICFIDCLGLDLVHEFCWSFVSECFKIALLTRAVMAMRKIF